MTRQSFILSIAVMYPEGTSNEDLAALVSNLPKHPELQVVLCENVVIKGAPRRIVEVSTNGNLKRVQSTLPVFEFDTARNTIKGHCDGKWILSLDLDEYIATPISAVIGVLKQLSDDTEGVTCTILSHVREPGDNVLMPYRRIASTTTRLFRNIDTVQWLSRCHEVVDFTIPPDKVADSSITILHYGYDTTADELKGKYERNIQLLAKEVSDPRTKDTYDHALRYLIVSCTQYNNEFC